MHFPIIVIMKNGFQFAEVDRLLRPFDEGISVAEYLNEDGVPTTYNPESRWDWWQIGGRWTGVLSGTYNPREDAANIQTCTVCDGTGVRPGGREQFGEHWFEATKGCNGCEGTGQSLKWPTEWASFVGDCVPVDKIPGGFVPCGLVTPDGEWHGDGALWCGGPVENARTTAGWETEFRSIVNDYLECSAVIVDCHI